MPQGLEAGTQANRVRITDKVTSMHLEDGGGMVLAARQKGKDWLICTTSACAESTVVARVRCHKDGTWTSRQHGQTPLPPPPCSARARRLRILRAPFGCRLGTPLGENRPRGAQPPPRVLEPAASTASTVASIAASIASTASGPAGAKHLRYPCIIPLAVQVRSRARAQQDDGVGVSGGVPRDHAVTLPQTPTPNSNPNPNPNPNPNQVRHATHSVSESLPELNVLSGALTPDSQP